MKEKTKKTVIGVSAALLILGAAGATVAIVNHQNHFIDDIAARTGTVTIKNLWAKDLNNLTDAEKAIFKVNDDGDYVCLAGGQVYSDVEDADEIGDIYFSPSVCPADTGFNFNETDDAVSNGSYVIAKGYDTVQTNTNLVFGKAGDTVKNPALYKLNGLGYKSLAKTEYVFGKLTRDMTTIKGDLTFKKADVLKYANAYEDSLKAAASSAAASTTSSAA